MTTLSSLNSDAGVAIQVVVAIEGVPYLITDGSPSAALTAFGSSGLSGHTDYSSCLGGLKVHWDQSQRIDPWKPFTEPPILQLSIVPATDNSGNLVDTLGVAIAKRTPTTESDLTTAIDCDDTDVVVQRTNSFDSFGVIHIGPEAMYYGSKDDGTATFTVSQRGKYNPFHTSGDARFARAHSPVDFATVTGADVSGVTLRPEVTSSPTQWIGRWVGVWILKVTGSVLDVPDTDGHLAFAGTIAEIVEDEEGKVNITLEDVRRRIYETVLHRDQFTASLREGIRLRTDESFTLNTYQRITSSGVGTNGNANPLIVVESGASGANQINAGVYTHTELASALNRWFASEKDASRILFSLQYSTVTTTNGSRAQIAYTDPDSVAKTRRIELTSTDEDVLLFLGWGDSTKIAIQQSSQTGTQVSGSAPRRFSIKGDSVEFVNPRGTWISQRSTLPSILQYDQFFTGIDGVLRIGDQYLKAQRASDTEFSVATTDGQYFPLSGLNRDITIDDPETEVTATQVIVWEGQFASVLLNVLLSTGTSGFNSSSFDIMAESISCGIPWSILGEDFEDEVAQIAAFNTPCTLVLDKPTRFVDVFEPDFVLRRIFFRWANGRLGLKGWDTPHDNSGAIALDETTKAVPVASASTDTQRSTVKEDDSVFNTIVVKSGRTYEETYPNSTTIYDATSIQQYGSRVRTLEVRTIIGPRQEQTVGQLIGHFQAGLSQISRPSWHIRRSLDRKYFEQCPPGTLVLLTDKFVRSPDTGLRYNHQTATGGLSSHPAIVVSNRHDWGGPGRDAGGEIELKLIPRYLGGKYAPCAQVDSAATNAGYNAGTYTLTCKDHEHSQTGDAVDTSFFAATDVVRIIEIDPSTAGSPTTWTRTVASVSGSTITLTSALSSPSWDTAKKYRITYAGYASCTAAQQAKVFQADDADGMVVDSRRPYQMISSPSGQGTFELCDPTDVHSRYSTYAYGDGVPLDTGYERDIALGLNNFVHYKSAPQSPVLYSTTRAARAPTGTWELIDMMFLFIGIAQFPAKYYRKLYIAPFFRSSDGSLAEIRATVSRYGPYGSSRQDVSFYGATASSTWTSSSTTWGTGSPAGLDVSFLQNSGYGYLSVEVKDKTEFRGFGVKYLGPLETGVSV